MSLRAIVFPLVEYLGADDSRRWPSLASYTSIVLATPSGPGSSDPDPLLGFAGNPVVKKAKYEYCYQFSGSQMASKIGASGQKCIDFRPSES